MFAVCSMKYTRVFGTEGVSGVEKLLLQSDGTATRHSEVIRKAGRQTPPPPLRRTYVDSVASNILVGSIDPANVFVILAYGISLSNVDPSSMMFRPSTDNICWLYSEAV